ncbi:MAG TPA: amidase family protein [Candidatus Binataceae bacterium]|nr:amidase family protein [Candidatus Binataceae bacterium]
MSDPNLDLCYMTATEAIAAFKARSLSPVELLKAIIARCEQLQPKVNALTYTYFDRALEQAKAAEARYAGRGGQPRPLEGVTVAIKDFHPVKGEITTFGSKMYRDYRPDYTAPTVQRLLDAGAIMHCRTTTPEFAHTGVTASPLWGITRNPWNLEYTPGGSSGGAGAALAGGMTTLADGTDGGGSIRIPASATGVVGYKPPFGRNPLDSAHPLETILHYGPMAREVADAALMQNIMSGPHLDDICSLREKILLPELFEDIKGSKIAYSLDLGFYSVDPEVRRNTLAAVEVFKSLGCRVEEVNVGWNWGVANAWATYWAGLFAGLLGGELPRWRYEMTDALVRIIESGLTLSAEHFYRINLVRGEMYRTLGPILENYNVLICPTLALPAVKHDHNPADSNFTIAGEKVPASIGWFMTLPFNLVSQCPVIAVPTGFATSGIPTGMQIVGKTFDDLSVFRAAAAYEKVHPWRAKRPAI